MKFVYLTPHVHISMFLNSMTYVVHIDLIFPRKPISILPPRSKCPTKRADMRDDRAPSGIYTSKTRSTTLKNRK